MRGMGELVTCDDPSAWDAFVSQASDISSADVIVIAVGTPTDDSGRPDVSQVDAAAAKPV